MGREGGDRRGRNTKPSRHAGVGENTHAARRPACKPTRPARWINFYYVLRATAWGRLPSLKRGRAPPKTKKKNVGPTVPRPMRQQRETARQPSQINPQVLSTHFPGVALAPDIRALEQLPDVREKRRRKNKMEG